MKYNLGKIKDEKAEVLFHTTKATCVICYHHLTTIKKCHDEDPDIIVRFSSSIAC